MTNPFRQSSRDAERSISNSQFDLATVISRNTEQRAIAVQQRSSEETPPYPVIVPEDTTVPQNGSLVIIGRVSGSKDVLLGTVDSPDGSTTTPVTVSDELKSPPDDVFSDNYSFYFTDFNAAMRYQSEGKNDFLGVSGHRKIKSTQDFLGPTISADGYALFAYFDDGNAEKWDSNTLENITSVAHGFNGTIRELALDDTNVYAAGINDPDGNGNDLELESRLQSDLSENWSVTVRTDVTTLGYGLDVGPDNNLFVAAEDTIYKYDSTGSQLASYTHTTELKEPRVTSNGVVLVGEFEGTDVLQFDNSLSLTATHTTSISQIYSLSVGKNNNLYVCGNAGISKVEVDTGETEHQSLVSIRSDITAAPKGVYVVKKTFSGGDSTALFEKIDPDTLDFYYRDHFIYGDADENRSGLLTSGIGRRGYFTDHW